MARKLTHEFVWEQFALEGYELLSLYSDNRQKLDYICPKGHKYFITWSSFKSGKRCAICARKAVNVDYVKSTFLSNGYILQEEYQGATKKMRTLCPKNHEYYVSWHTFQKGHRCVQCFGTFNSQELVKTAFQAENFTLLSEYKNSKSRLDFICPQGHKHFTNWSKFQRGRRCAVCADQVRSHADIEKAFTKEGYTLLTEYKNNHTPLKFLCPNEHQHSIRWNNFKAGQRCVFCHTKDFYKIYQETTLSKIKGCISREIKRQGIDKHWSDFYHPEILQILADQCKAVYKRCKPGEHVDHIVPISWFNVLIEEELKACWSINNLRAISAVKNLRKKNKMSKQDIINIIDLDPTIYHIASKKRTDLDFTPTITPGD